MTEVEKLARYVTIAQYEDLSEVALDQLKLRVLDSFGVGIGALQSEPIRLIRSLIQSLGGNPISTLIGGSKTSPDRAAFFNGALIRYLDFNDSFLAPHETCHPSDNIAPVLAAAEMCNSSGKEFLTALAVAYQVQIRLSEVAPVRDKGFDHTTQGAYSVAAGVSKALSLTHQQTANAIAISGTANNALRVTRTGALSNWKGLAFPQVAMSGLHCALLARHGVTGPLEVFEGNKGFKESIAGPFQIAWEKEDLEGVNRTIIKKYNAEVHSQSAIDAVLTLKRKLGFSAEQIDWVDIDTFQVAYDIIGGGEEGSKTVILTKEEADHSFPYLIAVALLDGNVLPSQFIPQRITQGDVQALLQRVRIHPDSSLSSRFPKEMPVCVRIRLKDDRLIEIVQSDYDGFTTRPMSWDQVQNKFDLITSTLIDSNLSKTIVDQVRNFEQVQIKDLMHSLSQSFSQTLSRSA